MTDYLDILEAEAQQVEGAVEAWAPYRVMGALVDERFRLGFTQQELADKIGTTQAVVARMERDPSKVSFDRVLRYAAAVGMPFTVGMGTFTPKESRETRGRKSKRLTNS